MAQTIFDFIRYMGNDLDGFPKVIPAALLAQNLLVDLAGGQIVAAGEAAGGEAFVVTKIEISLGPVFQDVDLSMLVRAHRARVDVEIRVKFHQGDFETASFQEGAEGGGGKALA